MTNRQPTGSLVFFLLKTNANIIALPPPRSFGVKGMLDILKHLKAYFCCHFDNHFDNMFTYIYHIYICLIQYPGLLKNLFQCP